MERIFERAKTFNQYIGDWILHQNNISTRLFDGATNLEFKNIKA